MYNEELSKPRRTTPNPCIVPSCVPSCLVYTAAEQDLGMPYQPVVAEYARIPNGGLINIP